MSLSIGELFAGYGGLGMGVASVLDAEIAWYSEVDKGALKVLAHRFPGVPNIGDITTADWSQVPPVDILTGGSPCQDLSHAGKRAGMTIGTRSNLWVAMREAIAQLRPRLVIWENVRGAYSAAADSALEPCAGCLGDRPGVHLRALGRVLGDLSSLGYVGGWHGLRAADVGAPHGRFRVFVVAYPASDARWIEHRDGAAPADADGGVDLGGRARPDQRAIPAADGRRTRRDGVAALLPSPRTSDTNGAGHHGDGGLDLRTAVSLLGTPTARDHKGTGPVGSDSYAWLLKHGNVEAQVLSLQGGADLVGDGVTGDILSGIDGDEVADVADGFGAQVEVHGQTLAPIFPAGLALPGETSALLPTPAVNDMGEGKTVDAWDEWTAKMQAAHGNGNGHGKSLSIEAQRLLPTPRAGDGEKGGPNQAGSSGDLMLPSAVQPDRWGQYAAAIHRWETLTRPAPPPTEPSAKGTPRLSAAFSEWLMGLPAGWVTDVPGITRNEALKALGNGVVPQQSAAAVRFLLAVLSERGAA